MMNEYRFDKKLERCILCDSSNINSLTIDYRGINIDRCSDCGFQFMNPQYTDEYLNEYYANYTHEDDYNYWKEATTYGHGFYLSLIENFIRPGKMLDIGCGTGTLIEAAISRGWSPVGYDVDKDATEKVAARTRVTIYSGNFFDLNPGENFDLVTMHQVLEHVKNPNDYLEKVNSLLKDKGILFIAVPNIKSFSNSTKRIMERIGLRRKNIAKYYDTSHHLLYFEPATLKQMLQKHGFNILFTRNCHTVRPNQSKFKRYMMRNLTDHLHAKSAFLIIAEKKTDS